MGSHQKKTCHVYVTIVSTVSLGRKKNLQQCATQNPIIYKSNRFTIYYFAYIAEKLYPPFDISQMGGQN